MTNIAQARPSLTSNDAAVLQALFDAESSPSTGITIDPSLPSWPPTVNIAQSDLESLRQRELEIIHKLQSSDTPSEETVQAALAELDALLEQYPTYPPAYSNRAQTLRLQAEITHQSTNPSDSDSDSDTVPFTPRTAYLASRILSDLGQAITLSTPSSPADAVSSAQARLLADTHTHRGYLLLKAARLKKNLLEFEWTGLERLRRLGADQLEEMASRDFFLGGRYGNKVAQQLAVQTNPYAKMCGVIVKEAMRKEVEG